MSYLRPRVVLRIGCEGVSAICRMNEADLRIVTTDLLAMRDEAQRRAGRRAGMYRLRIFVPRCFRVLGSIIIHGSSCLRLQADRLSSP